MPTRTYERMYECSACTNANALVGSPIMGDEARPDHWKEACSGKYDDQTIHYRIADLLEEILNKLQELIEQSEGE